MQQLEPKPGVEKARKRCLRKFLHYFKKGFDDQTYIDWERQYKVDAHIAFTKQLNKLDFKKKLKAKQYLEIAQSVVKIESSTNLLFSFEKMALRDAVKSPAGARNFSIGLYDYLYGKDSLEERFESFVKVIGELPRIQTRVLTWPVVTVFGFLGNPQEHIFLKPRVTQAAAEKFQFPFEYVSRPEWKTYESLLNFAKEIKKDTEEVLHPKDYIDLQSFIWVMGSDEYPD